MVSGCSLHYSTISVLTTRPSPGKENFVNEELQDRRIPSLLHDDQERNEIDIHLASHGVPYLCNFDSSCGLNGRHG
jgi:hypothetical protein